MRIISRSEARALGLKRYFTGKPCKHGHVSERWVAHGVCAECARAATAAWRAKNQEREQESKAAWRAAHPDECRAHSAAWAAKNRDERRETAAAWRAKHPEKKRETDAAWQKNNPGKRNANNAKRKARKLHATPAWADLDWIAVIYDEASARGLTVDHIVPLQGRNVCGLHCPANLQLLTAAQNSAKGNRHA